MGRDLYHSYPVFAEVRRAGPVHYAPSIDMYLVTRYDDIEAIFRDPLTYSAATAQDPITPLAGRAADRVDKQQVLLGDGLAVAV